MVALVSRDAGRPEFSGDRDRDLHRARRADRPEVRPQSTRAVAPDRRSTTTGAPGTIVPSWTRVEGDFQVSGNTCGAKLGAGASCTIGVTFKPAKKGARTGTLTIKDFNVNGPLTVVLNGTGS